MSVIRMHIIQTLDSSIWSIDRILSGSTTPSQIWSGRYGNEGVVYISQISRTVASTLDVLVSYPKH